MLTDFPSECVNKSASFSLSLLLMLTTCVVRFYGILAGARQMNYSWMLEDVEIKDLWDIIWIIRTLKSSMSGLESQLAMSLGHTFNLSGTQFPYSPGRITVPTS